MPEVRENKEIRTVSTAQDILYSSSNYHARKHGVTSKTSEIIGRYRTSKFSAFLKNANSEILEVGVGPGWNLVHLPARRRVGMDVTTAYAEQLRGQGVEFVSDLEQLAGQQFDLVILSHVMEHLLEPARMLEQIGKLLKPEGEFLVIVPLEAPARKISPKDDNHHLYSWNAQTLNEFLLACSFSARSLKIKRYGFDRFAANLAVRLKGGYGLYRILLFMLRAIRPGYEIKAIASYKPKVT
jgi:SAM-dependent methyltransferase